MTRSLAALAARLLPPGGAAAAPEGRKEVQIVFHGQSFFEIKSSKGTRIVTDPHAIPEYGRNNLKAHAVTVSHFHNDHTQVDAVLENAKGKVDGFDKVVVLEG